VFAAAVWCATMAAPAQALASVTGCSHNEGATNMPGCRQVFCGADSSANPLSQGLSTARSQDTPKTGILFYGVPPDGSAAAALLWKTSDKTVSYWLRKISTRLLNSVLNL
jgi:hypothetical protein